MSSIKTIVIEYSFSDILAQIISQRTILDLSDLENDLNSTQYSTALWPPEQATWCKLGSTSVLLNKVKCLAVN